MPDYQSPLKLSTLGASIEASLAQTIDRQRRRNRRIERFGLTEHGQTGHLIAAFGHLGDNNLHVSVIAKSDRPDAVKRIEHHIYECLRPYQGAVSAEHGIGLEKKAYLPITRNAAEIDLMKKLKTTLDPNNILNPGKVITIA